MFYIGGSSNVNVQGQFLRGPGIGGSGGSDGSVIGEIIIDGGTVVAKGADAAPDIGVARIAGNFNDPNRRLGKITINGGNITDIGGDQYDHYYGGPGIGTTTTPFDSITISGGNVTATGGYGAAGIGSGINNFATGICTGDSIVISGGTVTATGDYVAPGIGTYGMQCYITDVIIENSNVTVQGDAEKVGDGIAGVVNVTITNAAITSNDVKNSVQTGGTVLIEGESAEMNLSGTQYAIDADNVTINQHATTYLEGENVAVDAYSVTISDAIMLRAYTSNGSKAIEGTQTTLDNEAGKDNTYLATSGLVPQTSDLVPFAPGDNKLTSAKWSFVDPNLTLENEGNDPYCVRK